MRDAITTFGELADELGVYYAVIAGLVRAHNLPIERVPRSGNAKGLSRKSVAVIRRALGLRRGERVGDKRETATTA